MLKDLNGIYPQIGVYQITKITVFNLRTEASYTQDTFNKKYKNNREALFLEGTEEPLHDRSEAPLPAKSAPNMHGILVLSNRRDY